MDIIELLAELVLLFTSSGKGKAKESLSKVLAVLLMVSGLVWLLLELPILLRLVNPFLFVGLAAVVSLAAAILLVVALFLIRCLAPVTRTGFVLLVLAFTLNFVSAASLLNRKSNFKLMAPLERQAQHN